jgi:aminoglycoside 3-N-acetyltransferase
MGIDKIIKASPRPSTIKTMATELRTLGVAPGQVLMVHSSLASLGYVAGGAQAVIAALLESLGDTGTLAMPAHTTDFVDPATWENPPVPDDWHEVIRNERPPFIREVTPSQYMGTIAECFRTWPGTLRSDHPLVSWCARGPAAQDIIALQSLDNSQGDDSPLGHLYDLHARVLLLGAGYDSNTCFHLAEYRCKHAESKRCERSAVQQRDDTRVETTYRDIHWSEDDFADIGAELEREDGAVIVGRVGLATVRLFSMRRAVDFAAAWMDRNR